MSLDTDFDLFFFGGNAWSRHLRNEPLAGIGNAKRLVKRFVPGSYRLARTGAQAFFSIGASSRQISLYHEPGFLAFQFRGPTVLSVHDLAWILYPETHPVDRVRHMCRFFPRSLERATQIITDAEFIRQQVIDILGVSPERVTSVPLAARENFRPRDPEDCKLLLARLCLEYDRFFLCVGTIEPRKNLEQVLHAYGTLTPGLRRRFPLVIAGMHGWLESGFERALAPLVRAGDVRLLGYVEEAVLAVLYASSRALIYPSRYEGFGLPPLEAMASGTPVVASKSSALPEVVGIAGILVDPNDVDGLRKAIENVMDDDALCVRLAAAGLERAAEFSWQKCASQTKAVYLKALRTAS